MIAQEALRQGVIRLREAGIEDAARDARVLLAFAMALPQDRLTLHLADDIKPAQQAAYDKALSARLSRQPVAQIIGQRHFWGRVFRVTPDVLDPRPDTETLVEWALKEPAMKVLDLGTGSGCILLSVLGDLPMARGTGVDLSPAALAVAQGNAEAQGLASRARFQLSDWFTQVEGRFDLILSNPPYIAADEMPSLAPEVRDWEPHLALTPGGDGLDAYRTIAQGAPARLLQGGRLIVEIGPNQGRAVADLFARAGLQDIAVHPDLDGRDRVVFARKGE
ncbi:peptide chain release factor N(5)-glutamine methyltransferase [Neogemmobacter tilapiae]|uniref:Release factor glutamine methyltransferase n=1 Tax=Neogemmobacter tilapiae TaxID=875041 RepID=A0A918TFV6_9RHOB|nr:peptide chain release factor N(5)-glutamine methyltransferase [Gemmobacter tilapiae]GHC45844.1 release factor glutamine methyltransferase [Gemmobacter tilapiae]